MNKKCMPNIHRAELLALVLGSALVFSSTNVLAAPEPAIEFSLEDVIVSATRTEKAVKSVPASVDVITAEEIAARNITSVTEALQMKAGVYLNPIAQGGLSIRGFGSADILVLLDGQPMNSSWNGTMNWEVVPVERIARIEVVRGAASSLYGGRAVGAVVNIITKATDRQETVSTSVAYGSNNTWKKTLYLDQKLTERLSIGLGFERRSTDGYRGYYRVEKASPTAPVGSTPIEANLPKLAKGSYVVGGRGDKEWENENRSFSLKYIFSADQTLNYTYMKSENTYSYNNPFSYARDAAGNQIFDGVIKTQHGDYVVLKPGNFLGYVGKRETDVHTLNYRDDHNNVQLNLGFYDTKKDGYSSASGVTDINWQGKGTNSFYPGKAYNVDLQKSWRPGVNHTLIVGVNAKQESFDQTRYNLSNYQEHNSIIDFYEQHGGKAKNVALFIQDEYQLNEAITLYTGIRYDYYKKQDGYSYFYKNGILNHNQSKEHGSGNYTELSPKVAVEYKVNENTRYYTSYGHSFNPPILYQVYRYGGGGMGSVIANPDLEPEISDTFELGLKRTINDRTNLGLSLFKVNTKDKVDYITHYVSGTNVVDFKRYENAGSEQRRGLELDLKHQFNSQWTGYINYTWQSGKITGITGTVRHNYDIPKHLLHSGVAYNKNKLNVILDAQYVSERQASDAASGEYQAEDAFFIVNSYLNYKLAANATLQAGIQNLFDKHFYAGEATAGRTYTLGVRYQF